jgi:hypothetical protein
VYVDDPSASDPTSTGTQIFATGSGNNDEWFFDYQSGVLHFISTNLPSSVSDSKSIYISGARYIGEYGQPGSFEIITANVINAVTADFANSVTTNVITAQTMTVNAITANVITANSLLLDVPLPANSGGTGLDSFTTNGILFASDTETLSFVTGTSGKILQINSTGEPVFDDLNGGTY